MGVNPFATRGLSWSQPRFRSFPRFWLRKPIRSSVDQQLRILADEERQQEASRDKRRD